MNSLAGRIAVITGGGRGIGRAVALAFAREGADVMVLARTGDEVRRVAEEVRDVCGVRGAHAVCDVADAASVERAFALPGKQFGRAADILVNNAGIAESAPFVKTADELWRRHLDVNLSGTFYCMRAALPAMIERGWGRVINIASIAGKTGAPYIAAYAASKHGVLGLTRSAAVEVATRGVTVNAICPGYVETDMTERAVSNITARTGKSTDEARAILERMSPQQRLVTPEEVAAVALLLAGHEGRGINGQAINVDGGSVLF
ncbi:MAG TPA: SDR family NAD(P)-dependent oxidoreductase [Pyrinomonadaceae bacterium]|jgi:NAD(P)-dependent dehydrogenase (short-subunit alcohol dehydrogenase family)